MNKNTLIIVVGTTAIGKTAKAIQLAQHFNCDVVSFDSRQFYKEMSIGTAVPSQEELAAVPHHFIQHKSIFETYTVGDFEREAIQKLDALFAKNPVQVMVGGSGLYMDAVIRGFDDFPEVDQQVRQNIRAEYEKNGISHLQYLLKQVDGEYYKTLKKENPQTLENPQRLMRFIEVSVSSGKPYSSFLNQKKNSRNFTSIIVGLEAERHITYQRINDRVDLMVADGLIAEARELYPHKELNALQTVGYRELFEYFNDKLSLEKAIDLIKMNTRRFAKRQLTWFQRNPDTIWFDYKMPASEIIQRIEEKKE
ncbi:MAG TPA: tRNA (adenosine(37)-N6)-dimethylallyltransferase MiaA [Flavobacterium sp.]|nr:tRNA (adenosine(37)-N6)-dimethylallyltransferase MiaA [Flavobacterium sp.]